jgi:hypothetical protein
MDERDWLAERFEANRVYLRADALVAVLDPDVVLRADVGAGLAGASREIRGAAPWPGRHWPSRG